MSMPPSGVEGLMDEQSVIEAEIQLELENINLEDEVQLEDDLNGDVGMQQDFEGQDGVSDMSVQSCCPYCNVSCFRQLSMQNKTFLYQNDIFLITGQ